MSEYRTAHARWASKEVGKAEWGAVGAMLDDERRIRALEKALREIVECLGIGGSYDEIADCVGRAETALQRPDDHRQPRQDERPDGQADG